MTCFCGCETYVKNEDGTTEEWNETVERCINGAQKIGAQYTPEEAERIYDYVFNLKCNFMHGKLGIIYRNYVWSCSEDRRRKGKIKKNIQL